MDCFKSSASALPACQAHQGPHGEHLLAEMHALILDVLQAEHPTAEGRECALDKSLMCRH